MAMDSKEIAKQQSYYVAKSNKLIQTSKYTMSMLQSKGLLYLVSHIRPGDTAQTIYEIAIPDFCDVCGIEKKGGKTISEVMKAIQKLADMSVWIEQSDTDQKLHRWIDTVVVSERRNVLLITFHKDMIPYLFELRSRYTQYQLKNILPMQSRYAIRLYELLSSYRNKIDTSTTFELKELRSLLDAEKYTRFPDFRRHVLDPAVEDVNSYTDIKTMYETLTDGTGRGTVVAIKFRMLSISALEEQAREREREAILNPTAKAKRKARAAQAEATLVKMIAEESAKKSK